MKTFGTLSEQEKEPIVIWIRMAKLFAPACTSQNLSKAVEDVFKVKMLPRSVRSWLKQYVSR